MDSFEPLHTLIMQELERTTPARGQPLGTKKYRASEQRPKNAPHLPDAVLGYGSPDHGQRFCLYGRVDDYLRSNTPNDDPILRCDAAQPLICTSSYWRQRRTSCPSNITPATIASAARRAIHRYRSEQRAQVELTEWRWNLADPRPDKSNRWNLITFPRITEPLTQDDLTGRIPAFIDLTRLDPGRSERHVEYSTHPTSGQPAPLASSDAQIFNKIRQYQSLPIMSSDSGRIELDGEPYIVASAVLYASHPPAAATTGDITEGREETVAKNENRLMTIPPHRPVSRRSNCTLPRHMLYRPAQNGQIPLPSPSLFSFFFSTTPTKPIQNGEVQSDVTRV